MSRLKWCLILLSGLTGLVCPLSAQDTQSAPWDYRFEFFGNIGWGRFYHFHKKWGTGLDWGGGVGVRPSSGTHRGIGLEVQFASLTADWVQSSSSSLHLDARLIAGHVLFHAGAPGTVQPYFLGGLGWVNADRLFHCENCVYDVDPVTGALVPRVVNEHTRRDRIGFSVGAGLKIALERYLSLRPEIFYFIDPSQGYNWFRIQIGLGAHF